MRRDSLYVLCRLTPEDAAELSALEEKCFPSFWTAEQYAKALGKGSPYLSLGCRMDGRLAGYITVSEVAGELEIINVGVEPPVFFRRSCTRPGKSLYFSTIWKSGPATPQPCPCTRAPVSADPECGAATTPTGRTRWP